MQVITLKRTNVILTLVVLVLFCGMAANAQSDGDQIIDGTVNWIGGNTGANWNDGNNWEATVLTYDAASETWGNPTTQNIIPQPLDADHGPPSEIEAGESATVNSSPPTSEFYLNLYGTLDINAPFETNRSARYFTLGEGGVVNQYDDFSPVGNRGFRFNMTDDFSSELNLYGGTFDTSDDIEVRGDYHSKAEVNVYGGAISATHAGVGYETADNLGESGVGNFNVAGSGSSSIQFTRSGGNGWTFDGGTLQIGIDDGGVTTIEAPNGDVQFKSNSILDLSFLDGYEEYGTAWRVMEWGGDLLDGDGNDLFGGADYLTLDDVPLSLGADVDPDAWRVEFHKTNSGYMEITAVPEPGSLALLLIGAACLFTGRRRRRK